MKYLAMEDKDMPALYNQNQLVLHSIIFPLQY